MVVRKRQVVQKRFKSPLFLTSHKNIFSVIFQSCCPEFRPTHHECSDVRLVGGHRAGHISPLSSFSPPFHSDFSQEKGGGKEEEKTRTQPNGKCKVRSFFSPRGRLHGTHLLTQCMLSAYENPFKLLSFWKVFRTKMGTMLEKEF